MATKKGSKSQLSIAPSKKSRLDRNQGRSSVMLYPKLLEKKFEMQVVKLMSGFSESMRTLGIAMLPQLEKEFDASMRADGIEVIRMDEFTDSVNDMATALLSDFREKLIKFKTVIADIAADTNKWNKAQTNALFKEKLGVDILSNDRDLNAALDIWVRDNVKGLAGLGSDEVKRFEKIIVDGYRNGLRHEAVAKGLLDAFKPAADRLTSQAVGMSLENRAKLLASDQLGKLNASVTRVRQTRLGIKRYKWRCSMDESVRGYPKPGKKAVPLDRNHWKREGKIFYYSAEDGPVPEDGHPGMPVRCRCYAEPVLDDLFE